MRNLLALVGAIGLVTLTACTSQLERRTASGSYDYVKHTPMSPLAVPEDLDVPSFSQQYKLPELGEAADTTLVGRNLTVVSPRLVLPVVSGSRVIEGARTAKIMFDQVDDSQPLSQSIWNSLLGFLEEQNIGVDSFDPETGKLVTDWLIITKENEDDAWYSWETSESQIGERFEFNLEMKPHGRAGVLSVELRDYMETTNDKVETAINALIERSEEVNILNQVVGHYQYQIDLADSRRWAKIRSGLASDMGFDKDGEPAFIVYEKYDVVWHRMLLVLRKLGFDVKDLDMSAGTMFVVYGERDSSWWEDMFSSDDPIMELGEYRLKVGELQDDSVAVTFMTSEKEVFSAEQTAAIYGKFAEVMAEDNLDI